MGRKEREREEARRKRRVEKKKRVPDQKETRERGDGKLRVFLKMNRNPK